MADRIQHRRDTRANWEQYNPVLMEGEIGLVMDDPNLYKVGDGTNAWNDLPFRGFDGTVVQETGNAEDAVMSQKAISELFIPLVWSQGYINSSGNFISSSGTTYYGSDFIPTYPNAVFNSSNIVLSETICIAFYDENQEFISALNVDSFQNKTFTVPENGYFVRLSSFISEASGLSISDALVWTDKPMRSYASLATEKLNKTKITNEEALQNFIPLVWSQGYINSSGNFISSSGTTYYGSDFIPTYPNAVFNSSNIVLSETICIAFYDENQEFISALNVDSFQNKTFTVPENGYFVRLSQLNTTSTPIDNARVWTDNPMLAYTKLFNVQDEHIVTDIVNNMKDESDLLPDGSQVISSSGAVEPDLSNYGKSGYVTAIPLKCKANTEKAVVRFKVRFTEDMNTSNPSITGSNAYIKIGALKRVGSTALYELSFVSKPNPVTNDSDVVGIAYNVSLGCANYNYSGIRKVDYSGIRMLPIAGDLSLKIQWKDTGNAQSPTISNQNGVFEIKNNNQSVGSFTLSSYSTMEDFVKALQANEYINVEWYGLAGHTPSDMIEFSDINLTKSRQVNTYSDEGGQTPTSTLTIEDNGYVYIRYKLDTKWHTFEIVADKSVSDYVCVAIDGVPFNRTERPIEQIFNENTVLYLGGTADGSNVNCEFSDLEVYINHLKDTELVYGTDGYAIISDVTPRLLLGMGHTMNNDFESDVEETQSADRMAKLFSKAKEKGYKPITLDDISDYIHTGKIPAKRGICIMYDDYQFPIYLNEKFRKIHTLFGQRPCFALYEHVGTPTFQYDDTTYNVSDLAKEILLYGWGIALHGLNESLGTTGYGELQKVLNRWYDLAVNLNYPRRYITYTGGSHNRMVLEECREKGFYLGVMTQAGNINIVKNANPMYIPRFSVAKSSTSIEDLEGYLI